VVGLGIQGTKRSLLLGSRLFGTVDPKNPNADFAQIKDAPANEYRDIFLCVPDEAKFQLVTEALNARKNVLVEKPFLLPKLLDFQILEERANSQGSLIYTAYNHRFEPHFMELRKHLKSKKIGRIYQVGMHYGNGTARLVAESPWRDRGLGVISDLLPHLLDTLNYWFDSTNFEFKSVVQKSFENKSPDYARVLGSLDGIHIDLEMSLCSWRNTFRLDIIGEKGSMHIDSLCKWGPSTFTLRQRVFPSGRPREIINTIEQIDRTWESEHAKFFEKIEKQEKTDLSTDLWIQACLDKVSRMSEEEKN
jgi:predicted dehydrogenase